MFWLVFSVHLLALSIVIGSVVWFRLNRQVGDLALDVISLRTEYLLNARGLSAAGDLDDAMTNLDGWRAASDGSPAHELQLQTAQRLVMKCAERLTEQLLRHEQTIDQEARYFASLPPERKVC